MDNPITEDEAFAAMQVMIDRLAELDPLRKLFQLKENWDSYGGLPPSPAALEKARRLLSLHVAPLPSGGLLLEDPNDELEIEIGPGGDLVFVDISGPRHPTSARNTP